MFLLFKLCAGPHMLFFSFSTVLDECKKGFENQVPMSAIWPTPVSLRIRTSPRGLCLGLLEKGWAEEDARGLRERPKRLETTATSRSARYQPPRFRRGPASWTSLRGPRLKEEEEETPRPDPQRGSGRRGARPSPASAPPPGLSALRLGPAPPPTPRPRLPAPAARPSPRPQAPSACPRPLLFPPNAGPALIRDHAH